MSKLAICGSHILLPGAGAPCPATINIDGERIVSAGANIAADGEKVEIGKLLIAPGIVDLGVFATDKPAFHFGGITRAALMPDQNPVHDDPATVRFNALRGKPDFWVHPIAAATQGLNGDTMAEIALMKEAGARAVSTGRRWIANSGLMYRLLKYAASLDLVLISHAEDAGLIGKAIATQGETATRLGLNSAPSAAEALAISRDLLLVKQTGARIHFRQVTTAMGLDLVRQAKAKGLPVTAGITPAHLFLNDQAVSDYRTFARISPPLRDESDRLACIDAIADGTIDVISSGHDPRGPEDKRLPFDDAAPGMAGAETLLALSLNLVREGKVTMSRLFECLSANPARILGVNAGQLTSGMEADLIGIDVETAWQIDSDKMEASAGNTPFDKLPVQGRVRMMMKGGRLIG